MHTESLYTYAYAYRISMKWNEKGEKRPAIPKRYGFFLGGLSLSRIQLRGVESIPTLQK